MRIRWPPSSLGLGTPLNLAALSPETRVIAKRSWWWVIVLAILTPALMLGLDQVFFAGSSLERIRVLGAEPIGIRILILLYSAVTEEIVYRLGWATLFAWLAHLVLARRARQAKAISQWIGVVMAAVLFGLAHVGNLPDVAHPVLRAVTVNGVAGVVLGGLYWWRGLEMAILTHLFAIALLYIALPPFL